MRLGKLKNGKAAGKDESTGEMIKGGGDGWCLDLETTFMAFDCSTLKGKGERSL